jgi:hypothetical protein
MLAISVPGVYALYEVGWDFSWKWPLFLLLGVFIASAIMHIVIAWRQRKR